MLDLVLPREIRPLVRYGVLGALASAAFVGAGELLPVHGDDSAIFFAGRFGDQLFEPGAEVRIKEQIDLMLRDIEKKHWKE